MRLWPKIQAPFECLSLWQKLWRHPIDTKMGNWHRREIRKKPPERSKFHERMKKRENEARDRTSPDFFSPSKARAFNVWSGLGSSLKTFISFYHLWLCLDLSFESSTKLSIFRPIRAQARALSHSISKPDLGAQKISWNRQQLLEKNE